jgi:hypothetical protein
MMKFDAQWVLGIHLGKIFWNAHSGIGIGADTYSGMCIPEFRFSAKRPPFCLRGQELVTNDALSRAR